MKTINANSTITARFVTDSDLKVAIKVIDRKGSFATIEVRGEGILKRKIHTDGTKEYIFPYGKYSMAPIAY